MLWVAETIPASCGNRRKFPLRNKVVKPVAPAFKSSEKARGIKAKRGFRFRNLDGFAPLQACNHGVLWLGCGNDFMRMGLIDEPDLPRNRPGNPPHPHMQGGHPVPEVRHEAGLSVRPCAAGQVELPEVSAQVVV